MGSIPTYMIYRKPQQPKPMEMIHINFNDLDDSAQQRLIALSKRDVEAKFGNQLRSYAKTQFSNYDELLEQEAIRNLYNYKYSFKIWNVPIDQDPKPMGSFFHSLVFVRIEPTKTNMGCANLKRTVQPRTTPIPYLTARKPFKNIPIKSVRHKAVRRLTFYFASFWAEIFGKGRDAIK